MNSNMKTLAIAAVAAATSTALRAAVPEVSNVTMTQDDNRLVTISYTLAEAPAVVTLDVQTNANTSASANDAGWTSIGGAAVANAIGDVWKEVAVGSRTIAWRPDRTWPDHKIAAGGARAVVTAWALDNTPDYMVVDISDSAVANTQKYYPAEDCLPGGLLSNDDYRTTKLVMRKIMARNVEWTMGSTPLETQRSSAREATHIVALTNNYYIGVFPVTQAQWSLVKTDNPSPSKFNNAADRAMRPVDNISYNECRNSANSTQNNGYNWPLPPNPASFLGKLRTKTGLDFDLPGEAQWEFAARAGNGDTKWGDGSGIQNTNSDSNLDRLGRYKLNGGYVGGTTAPDMGCGAENGTAVVGSYAPNDLGLYDTTGNLWEWCLDWYEEDIGAYGGKINIDPENVKVPLSGTPNGNATDSYYRVGRGGAWGSNATDCRPASRNRGTHNGAGENRGVRVVCTAGLQ